MFWGVTGVSFHHRIRIKMDMVDWMYMDSELAVGES